MNEPTNLAQARRTASNIKLASMPVGAAAPVKRKAVAVRSPRAVYWQAQYAWALTELDALPPAGARSCARQFASDSTDQRFGI